MLPGYSKTVTSTPDLLVAFDKSISSDKFESAALSPVRDVWLQLVTSLANLVNGEVEERKKVISLVESGAGVEEATKTIISSLQKEADLRRGNSSADMESIVKTRAEKRTKMELEASIQQYEKDLEALRDVNEDIMTRLKRMISHVTRVELEMEEMEQKLAAAAEEERRRAATLSPSVVPLRSSTPSLATAPNANGEASSDPGAATEDPSGGALATVSADAYADLASQKEELSKQLEEANLQLTSRLAEIEALHEEKRELLRKSTTEVSELRASMQVEFNGAHNTVDDEARLLKEEVAAKGDRVSKLLAEIKELRDAHASAHASASERTQKEIDEWKAKCERTMTKLKAMEAERDRNAHQIALLEQHNKEGLSHLPHLKMLQAKLSKEQDTVRRLQIEAQEKDSKILLLSAETHAAELQRLTSELKTCRDELEMLKAEATKIGAGEGEQAAEMAKVLATLPKLAEVMQSLAESQKKAEENADLIASLESALNETSAETEQLATELAEKEKRISSLLTERVNAVSAATQTKRLNSIEMVRANEAGERLKLLERVVERENRRSQQHQQECARLKDHIQSLNTTIAEKDKLAVHSVVALEILKKKLDSMNARIKDADEASLKHKLHAEEERQARARVEEELASVKRSNMHLKSSNALSSSTGVSASGGSDELVRYKKDVALYRSLFNCSLCDRKRQVNCAINPCGHTFCRNCIDEKCIKSRNRKCPKCKVVFGQNDLLSVYF